MFGFAKKLVSSIESQLSIDISNNSSSNIDESRYGLRILSVKPNSIGSTHGFESWFDFIVALNGMDINAFLEINTVSGNVGYSNMINYIKHEIEVSGNGITLSVFSSKGSIMRDIVITNEEFKNASKIGNSDLEEINLNANSTNDDWNPNLGLSFQLTPLSTGFFTWHVLRVSPGSPAYLAGIMPDEYIIQSQDGLLATGGEDLLGKVLQSQYVKNGDGCQVVLYVYNYDSDCVRPTTVILKSGSSWGGRGILGCDVGYGLLHRIPEVVGKFDSIKSLNQELPQTQGSSTIEQPSLPEIPLSETPNILPMKVAAPSFNTSSEGETIEQASKSVVSNQNRKRGHKTTNVNVNLDDYFTEQTKANVDSDGARSTPSSANVPPPPSFKKIVE